eukprot:9624072-Ditylum_brightwellii.AAC.1
MEKEFLSIVLCFKEFQSMLLGADITIHVDNQNLTFRTLSIQGVLQWRLFLDKLSPKFDYFPGKENTIAGYFCNPLYGEANGWDEKSQV